MELTFSRYSISRYVEFICYAVANGSGFRSIAKINCNILGEAADTCSKVIEKLTSTSHRRPQVYIIFFITLEKHGRSSRLETKHSYIKVPS